MPERTAMPEHDSAGGGVGDVARGGGTPRHVAVVEALAAGRADVAGAC